MPAYPSQTLPENPSYILDSEPSGPNQGYIDRRNPHAINSLTVGDLGLEEVLVSAHDDGDVCVWYTRDLTRIAIRRNVGMSAWGIALHKEKRLLAVSANSHLIYVYDLGIGDEERKAKRAKKAAEGAAAASGRFALSNENCWRNGNNRWRGGGSSDRLPASTGGVKVLKGHGHNIPSISFLDDDSGKWLVGTSIDGLVIVWDIESGEKAETTRHTYHK